MRRVIVVLAVGVFPLMAGFAMADESVPSAQTGPAMTVKASHSTVAPGQLITVDVYVSNVAKLSAYQFRLVATGGDQGSLALESVTLDQVRNNYVFLGRQVMQALNKQAGLCGALLTDGSSRDVTKPAYLGTATFRATSDARGAFEISIINHAGSSILADSVGQTVTFTTSAPTKVTVSDRVAPTRVQKRSTKR